MPAMRVRERPDNFKPTGWQPVPRHTDFKVQKCRVERSEFAGTAADESNPDAEPSQPLVAASKRPRRTPEKAAYF